MIVELQKTSPNESAGIVERLSACLGVPFARWSQTDEGWRCSDAPLRETSREFSAWLDEVVACGEFVVRRGTDGYLHVGMSLGDAQSTEVVAARMIDDAVHAVSLLTGPAMAAISLEQQSLEQRSLLEGYAGKLADSFEELTFLRKLSQQLEVTSAASSLTDLADGILPALRELTCLEGLAVFAATESTVEPPRVAGVVSSHGNLSASDASWHDTIEALAQGAQGIVVRNFPQQFVQHAGRAPLRNVRSVVVVPIAKNGVIFGWLAGVNKRRGTMGESSYANSLDDDEIGSMETTLLHSAAVMLATHAANVRLLQEKESLAVDVIHTLVAVIEAKDAYTCGHSERVALVGRRLAEQLALPAEECHDVYLTGLLHDIGKVGVPDDVLLSPDALTAAQFREIQRHPECGVRVLQRLKPLSHLLPGVLHHHEAIDGSGYPHQLAGEAIPLSARILAVADAWDAMTSDRPYRSGLPKPQAEELLRRGAGRQWDAQVVDAFFAVREDVERITGSWQNQIQPIMYPAGEEPSAKSARLAQHSSPSDANASVFDHPVESK